MSQTSQNSMLGSVSEFRALGEVRMGRPSLGQPDSRSQLGDRERRAPSPFCGMLR